MIWLKIAKAAAVVPAEDSAGATDHHPMEAVALLAMVAAEEAIAVKADTVVEVTVVLTDPTMVMTLPALLVITMTVVPTNEESDTTAIKS